MTQSRPSKRIILFFVAAASALLVTGLFWHFADDVKVALEGRMIGNLSPDQVIATVYLLLYGILGYLFVKALNYLVFDLAFRFRQGFDAPALVRNIFSIVAFTILLFIVFTVLFPKANLGAVFTTSAIFGVILGLALQDTLGNFFAGISLQADRPFQVGDVITVGSLRHTGVVEEISWRAIKIRPFQNHVVLIANSTAAKEPIEVCPRENQNARLVFFNTLYTESTTKLSTGWKTTPSTTIPTLLSANVSGMHSDAQE